MSTSCQEAHYFDPRNTQSNSTSDDNLSITSSQAPIIGQTDEYQQESRVDDTKPIFKVSKQRWAFLFAISVFGLTNSIVDSETPILHTMLDLLELPLHNYVYINMLLSYLPILTIIPTALLIDRFGIRFSLYAGLGIVFIRNTAKALLFNPNSMDWHRFKLAYWIIFGLARIQVLVIFYCTPLKISESWFPANERSTAWTVIMSSVNVGGAIASFSYPRIIHKLEDVKPLFYVVIGCTVASALAILTCVTKSKPEFPVSERSLISAMEKRRKIPFYISIKRIIFHKDLMIHCFHDAFFEGALNSVFSVQQDIMLASGFTKIFIGDLMTLNSIASIVLLICLSPLVNSIKNAVLACKMSSLIRSIMFIIYLVALLYPLDNMIIVIITIFYKLSRSWVGPNFNNMTAHLISGRVSEITIASFQLAISILTTSINQAIFMSLIGHNKFKPDYTDPIIFASTCGLTCSLVYVIFFKGQPASKTGPSQEQSAASQAS